MLLPGTEAFQLIREHLLSTCHVLAPSWAPVMPGHKPHQPVERQGHQQLKYHVLSTNIGTQRRDTSAGGVLGVRLSKRTRISVRVGRLRPGHVMTFVGPQQILPSGAPSYTHTHTHTHKSACTHAPTYAQMQMYMIKMMYK